MDDVAWLPPAVVPVEDPQRPQSVPPARPSVAVLEVELGLPWVGVLEQPGAVDFAFATDKLHRLGNPRIRDIGGAAEVVQARRTS